MSLNLIESHTQVLFHISIGILKEMLSVMTEKKFCIKPTGKGWKQLHDKKERRQFQDEKFTISVTTVCRRTWRLVRKTRIQIVVLTSKCGGAAFVFEPLQWWWNGKKTSKRPVVQRWSLNAQLYRDEATVRRSFPVFNTMEREREKEGRKERKMYWLYFWLW